MGARFIAAVVLLALLGGCAAARANEQVAAPNDEPVAAPVSSALRAQRGTVERGLRLPVAAPSVSDAPQTAAR